MNPTIEIDFSHHELRICEFCDGIMPEERTPRARYCNPRCGRKGHYWSMTEEERREYNKRSNTRRFEKDLKPKIREIVAFADEITHGSPMAQYVVGALCVQSIKDWRLRYALNYQVVREALADMAGGWDELERIETLVEDRLVKVMEQ